MLRSDRKRQQLEKLSIRYKKCFLTQSGCYFDMIEGYRIREKFLSFKRIKTVEINDAQHHLKKLFQMKKKVYEKNVKSILLSYKRIS